MTTTGNKNDGMAQNEWQGWQEWQGQWASTTTIADTMKGRGKGEEWGGDDACEIKGRGKGEMTTCARQEGGKRERREGVGYPHGGHLPTPWCMPHHWCPPNPLQHRHHGTEMADYHTHRQHTTHPQPCKQMLMGWLVGGMMRWWGRDNEMMSTPPTPSLASNCLWGGWWVEWWWDEMMRWWEGGGGEKMRWWEGGEKERGVMMMHTVRKTLKLNSLFFFIYFCPVEPKRDSKHSQTDRGNNNSHACKYSIVYVPVCTHPCSTIKYSKIYVT